jgi:hypothetical protein
MLAVSETVLAFSFLSLSFFKDSQILPICHSERVVLDEDDYGWSNSGIISTGQKRDIT